MSAEQSSFQPIAPKPNLHMNPKSNGEKWHNAPSTIGEKLPSNFDITRSNPQSRVLYDPSRDRGYNQIGTGSRLETLAELSSPTNSTMALNTSSMSKSGTGRPVFTVSGKTYEVGNKIPDSPKEDCNFAKRYQCLIKKRDTPNEDATLIQCSVCKRALTHVSCYINFVNADKNGHLQRDANSGKLTVTCGKACYNKVAKREKKKLDKIKLLSDKRRCIPWDRDAVTDGGPTSMSVLLDWITTKPNYARFNRGTRSNNTGETKYAISMEVVNAIKNAGISTPRTQEAVIAKISQLETDYDEAYDWLMGPGSTVKNENTVKAALLMRCRYYYDLYEVMQERALSNDELPMKHTFHSTSHSDGNHMPPAMRNNQRISHSTSHIYPVNFGSNSNSCCDGSHGNPVMLDSGSETGTHNSDDRANVVATNRDDCGKNSNSNDNRRNSESNSNEVQDGCRNNSKKRRNSGSDHNEVVKKAKETLTTLLCNEINHTSDSIIYEWLKANSAIHSDVMEEKATIRRLEEMKLKREIKTSRQDVEINKLEKRKMQIQLATQLGKNRMELRENGVSEAEINLLLPINLWKNEKDDSDDSCSESENYDKCKC